MRKGEGRVLSIIPPNYGCLFSLLKIILLSLSRMSYEEKLGSDRRQANSTKIRLRVTTWKKWIVACTSLGNRKKKIVSKRKLVFVYMHVESVSSLSALFFSL